MKKKRKKILEIIIISMIVLFAAYGVVKRVVISQQLKEVIIKKLRPVLQADTLDVASISMNTRDITLNNIRIIRPDYQLTIAAVNLKYSPVKLFQKGMNIKEWLQSIRIKGINYTIQGGRSDSTSFDWKFDISRFKEIIRKTADYAYLNTIGIDDFNLHLRDINGRDMPLLSALSGKAVFEKNHNITTRLQGHFAGSAWENVVLTGNIDYRYLLAHFDLEIKKSSFPPYHDPNGRFTLKNGNYGGNFTLDINRLGNEKIDLYGSIVTDQLEGILLEGIDFSDISLILSFYNGVISINRLDGTLKGTPFSISGAVYDILNPELDLYLSVPAINNKNITDYLQLLKDKTFLKDFLFGDKHTFYLHAHGSPGNYSFDFDYGGDIASYKNNKLEDITVKGNIKKEHLNIEKISAITGTNALNFTGSYFFSGKKTGQLELDYNATGSLYSEIPFLKDTRLSEYSTILKGQLKYSPLQGLAITSRLDTYDFSSTDSSLLASDLFLSGNKITISSRGSDNKELLKGELDLSSFDYNLHGDNILTLVNLMVAKANKLGAAEKVEFYAQGNKKNAYLNIFSQNTSSLYYGNLRAEASFYEDSLVAVTEVTPLHPDFNLPLKAKLKIADKNLSISSIKLADRMIEGEVALNFRNLALSGKLHTENLNFGSIVNKLGITTNTNLNCSFSGTMKAPYLALTIKENGFVLPEIFKVTGEAISGESEVYLENKKIRVEKLKLYSQNSKLMTMTGYLKNFDTFYFSTYGRFQLKELAAVFGLKEISGKLDYRLEGKGTLAKPQITLGELETRDLNLFGENIDYVRCQLRGEDEERVKVREFKAFRKDKIDLSMTGFIPYNLTAPLELNGYFLCDAFSYLVENVDVITSGSSVNEGSFAVTGTLKRPRLSAFDLYFLDGSLELDRIVTNLDNIKGKITLEDNMFLKLQDVEATNRDSGHKIFINNYLDYKGYEDITLPFAINAGAIALAFPEGGITARIPGMMKEGNYGSLQLRGHDNDKFVFAKRDGNFTLSGKVLLRNVALTYPFLDVPPFGTETESIEEEEEESSLIFDYVDFDLEVIPVAGNSFFYKTATDKKKNIWERLKESIFSLDKELNNVYIPLESQKEGLWVEGFYLYPRKFKLSGEVQAKGGSLNYSALSFQLEKASVRFDDFRDKDGYQDPYLTGIGKTRVRSRIDSTDIIGYEDIYVKVLTVDGGEIVDKEGARISEYSIQLQDADSNPWADRDNENMNEIDTEETVMTFLSDAVDQRVFSPLLSPLEAAIGNLLGAYIAIKPKVTSNIQNKYSYDQGSTYSFGNLLKGSEVYVSKFITDRVALSWNAEYIGDDNYKKDIDREFGYRNQFSIDYQLTNYLTTSYGYEYNSISDRDGYLISLSYRRKFMSLGSIYGKVKRLLRWMKY